MIGDLHANNVSAVVCFYRDTTSYVPEVGFWSV
jgi:hypothetical protein